MQFQFSVCMYGTCGRIDNKADFDLTFIKHVTLDHKTSQIHCMGQNYPFYFYAKNH